MAIQTYRARLEIWQQADKLVIPIIEGDGIGAELWAATQPVLDRAIALAYQGQRRIDWRKMLAGQAAVEQLDTALPDDTLDAFRDAGVGLKGPLMTPIGQGHRSLNVALRQALDLFVCLRPVRWFEGIATPLKQPEKVNMVIFRENTEDIYAGIEWAAESPDVKKVLQFLQQEMQVTSIRFPENSAIGIKPVSQTGSERLIRAAIAYAIDHQLPSVTLVHKGNIMKFTEGGFKRWGYALAEREFGDSIVTQPYLDQIRAEQGVAAAEATLAAAKQAGKIVVNDVIADNFLQNSLLKPEDYSVIATLNLNGDYISDQLAAMVGGVGIAPGGNINWQTGAAIFEATHGIAPDLVGQNRANPSSLLLSAAMMFDHLSWHDVAQRIRQALQTVFLQQKATEDLARLMPNGQVLSTREFSQTLLDVL